MCRLKGGWATCRARSVVKEMDPRPGETEWESWEGVPESVTPGWEVIKGS